MDPLPPSQKARLDPSWRLAPSIVSWRTFSEGGNGSIGVAHVKTPTWVEAPPRFDPPKAERMEEKYPRQMRGPTPPEGSSLSKVSPEQTMHKNKPSRDGDGSEVAPAPLPQHRVPM